MTAWLVVALVLLPFQDPIQEQIRQIDGKDVDATFRAIDALADLGPDSRVAIEKAAAALPEFYRDALLAELKTPVPAPRVSWSGGPGTLNHLREWSARSGFPILKHENDGLRGSTELSFDRAHALEALAVLCRREGLSVHQHPYAAELYFGQREATIFAFGHRSAAVVFNGTPWIRRVQDFGGDAAPRTRLNFETVLGPGVRVACWDRIRIYEAVGNEGVTLKEARPERKALMHDAVVGGRPVDTWDPKLNIALEIPDSVFRIERLRFSATGLVGLKERVLEFSGSTDGVQKREGFELEITPDRYYRPGIRIAAFRIRSNDPVLRKVLRGVFRGEIEWGSVKGSSSLWSVREIDGGISGEIEWIIDREQMRKRPCTCHSCCSCLHFSDEEIEAALPKGRPDRIRIFLPDVIRERTIFAEFRGIPVY